MIKTPDKKINLYIFIFLAVVTFATYVRVLHNDFVSYDDRDYVTENVHTQSGLTWNNIKWAFTAFECANWHPVTWLSLMLDSQLFGIKPWGYHLTNLLLHIVNTLILFAILNAMTGAVWRSAFVAAIFALHPLNVESVAWIAEKKNVLSTMFWLLTIGSYWKYSQVTNVKWYLLTLLLFALGLMSKPMVVTLPFVLLLLDYWPLERLKSLKEWKTIGWLAVEKLPFFVLSVISGIITLIGQKIGGAVVTIEAVPLSLRLTNAVLSYGKYIAKSFWPTNLAVLYPLEKDILIWKIIVSLTVLFAVSVFVLKFAGRNKYLFVGWLWYLGTLVPVIGIMQVGEQAMADRYAYVPIIGLFIMVGWGVWDLTEQWVSRRAILKILAGSIIVVLSLLTYIQAGYWKNGITLFEHALIAVPKDNGIIRCNLGGVYVDSGEYEKAKKVLEQAISIRSDALLYLNLGAAYLKTGQQEKALEVLNKSLEMNSRDRKTYVNLCLAYSNAGRYEEAVDMGRKAIELDPTWSVPYYNLSIAYRKMKKYPEEIAALKKAMELNPNNPDAYSDMGVVYMNKGQFEEAVEVLKKSVTIQPAFWKGHFNLGLTYVYLGNKEMAMEEYKILKGLNAQMAEKLLADINK